MPQDTAPHAQLAPNLAEVRRRIADAAKAAGRAPDAVTLLAVSKTFEAGAVSAALDAGQRAFGENYVQEGVAKIAALASLREELQWHFIGPLQSNKTRLVAEQFDWVHSVDRLRIAERLSEQRPLGLASLQICVQVNISGEESKSGFTPQETEAAVLAVARLPQLRLRGLMAIPEPAEGETPSRAPLAAMRKLFDQCNAALSAAGLAPMDTLSMGMSADLETAILEGATMVRVGTAIFGARDYAGAGKGLAR
ncbi:MAG: YggS family pyridoxal phosphate-dependent enzyme [Candidatus Protistobacter heckmanni]|nr:YggS family pyridoxal phosphate-dependent enzyme [Candidatus Protistobacter heckmanni]